MAYQSLPSQPLLATRIARLHYLEGLSNLQIAEQLGISRFRVARLLERATTDGTVTITIAAPTGVDQDLSNALIAKYAIADAIVCRLPTEDARFRGTGSHEAAQPSPSAVALERTAARPDTVDPSAILDEVAAIAARYLAEILHSGGSFGVTWGKAVAAVATALTGNGQGRATRALPSTLPTSDVVQLAGGLSSVTGALHAMDVLSRFAAAAHGNLYPLNAPLVVTDPYAAKALRADASIRGTLARVRDLDAAVVGIGAWNSTASQLFTLFDREAQRAARRDGATAEVSGIILDATGSEIRGEYARRTIRAASGDFLRIPTRIGVAIGRSKAQAVHAALTGTWVTTLITDAELAEALLSLPK